MNCTKLLQHYAARKRGWSEDLDRDFEAAAIEHWLEVKIP